jgi:hypothetical protein
VDVIDRNTLEQLSMPHELVGHMALRPMACPAIPAQLVKISVCLAESSDQRRVLHFLRDSCIYVSRNLCCDARRLSSFLC